MPGGRPATLPGMAAEAGPAPESTDWAVQAADTIERVVGTVRDRTAVPLDRAARAVVYGLLAGLLGAAATVLVVIGIVRLAEQAVPVWLVYAILAGIFVLLGVFVWSKRDRRSAP